ncbi:MAG: hypothetical protein ACI4BB_04190 [Coprococcus sp.]
MLKAWREDIRIKTKNMNRREKAEYVLTYYWYHILLATLFFGLIILLIYHIGWGEKKKEFTLVIVNQEVDFSRDTKMAKDFALYSALDEKRILVDSDYLISYGDVKLEGINESSYEKFFLNWAAGTLDAVIMPESFLQYCKQLDAEIVVLEEILDQKELESRKDCIIEIDGKYECIDINKTRLGQILKCGGEDRVVLIFPQEMKHPDACRKFLEYILYE